MPARMPSILLAATQTPRLQLPQMITPRSARPVPDRLAELARLVGVVDTDRVEIVRAEIDDHVPRRLDRLQHDVAKLHAAMVECGRDLHRIASAPSCTSRAAATASTVSPSSVRIRSYGAEAP